MKKEQNTQTKSRYCFRFNNIPADPDLERKTNLKLAQLLAIAPPGSTAVGFVEKNEKYYMSAIEVSSPYRTFLEKAGGLTPNSAIQRALEKLEDQLYRWRFGGGRSGNPFAPPLQFNQPQPQR
jgi:hypothetical protein